MHTISDLNQNDLSQSRLYEIQLFPPVYFFRNLAQGPILLEKHENYQKRSFRNKFIIAGANGPLTLTIPLKKGKHQGQLITDVLIAYDEPWQKKHLWTIMTAYQSAPYFEFYYVNIEKLYVQASKYLFDFDWIIIEYFCQLLDIDPPTFTLQYQNSAQQDLRGKMTPKNYFEFLVPPYNQVFEDRHGYLNNLSILDLLFCLGPESSVYLKTNPTT